MKRLNWGDYTFGFWVGLMAWRLASEPIPDWFLYTIPVITICCWIRGI